MNTDGGRRRRALVRVPGRRGRAASACTSRARTRPTASFRWMASPAIDAARQHRHRLLVRRDAALRRAALRRRAWRATRSGLLTLREAVLVEGEASAARDALGGLHDRRRWTRATTARSGTSATT
ncbi:MAG: hypothetical protein MZV63_23970 [Marinilabiliales bacterium]|nr:hypothetical protein [Marinilabiliales bacterium]